MIKLTINRFRDFIKEEKEEWVASQQRSSGMYNNIDPPPQKEDGLLFIEITETQFEAIRKEVLKSF